MKPYVYVGYDLKDAILLSLEAQKLLYAYNCLKTDGIIESNHSKWTYLRIRYAM